MQVTNKSSLEHGFTQSKNHGFAIQGELSCPPSSTLNHRDGGSGTVHSDYARSTISKKRRPLVRMLSIAKVTEGKARGRELEHTSFE